MKVSIIIPTYNEENVISECLHSLKNQTYKNIEIIVVDDGSTDKTLSEIRNLKLEIRNLHLLQQMHQGPGAARNLGAKHSSGEILVFVDSDMTFDKTFIDKLVGPIIKGETKGTFSKFEYVKNPNHVWSDCWGINEGWEKGMRHPKNYPETQKVFRAILKSEFDKVNGFSLTGYTDDWTLSQKLGYEAKAVKAVFYHKNPETLIEVFNQAKWIGRRKYKLGQIGILIAIIRSSLPVSIILGFLKSFINLKPSFIIFKIVYDFGIFLGAMTSLFGGGNAK